MVTLRKDNYRNNFNCEINNKETFYMLLEILRSNRENVDIYFSFIGSGMCKIVKKNNSILNKNKKILSRTLTVKNFLRKFLLNKMKIIEFLGKVMRENISI